MKHVSGFAIAYMFKFKVSLTEFTEVLSAAQVLL